MNGKSVVESSSSVGEKETFDLFAGGADCEVVLPENPEPWLIEQLTQERNNRLEMREAVAKAIPAMARLAEVLKGRSGQPYRLRGLLFSLWNGKPFSVLEIVGFDWAIRKDLAAVLLVFGFEDKLAKFFYDAVRDAIKAAGQWEWFIEESENMESLREWVKSADDRERRYR